MKSIIFSVIICLIAHSNAQLNSNEIKNLTKLFTDFKAQTSELFSNETLIKEVISTLTKQVEQLPHLLSEKANSTQQISDFIKPFMAHFKGESLDKLINFVQQLKNLSSNRLIGVDLIRKLEVSAKRVISNLLANKQVIDTLKQCLSSAERVFGKIDAATVWQRLQTGYNNQEARKILEKAFEDFSSLIFS